MTTVESYYQDDLLKSARSRALKGEDFYPLLDLQYGVYPTDSKRKRKEVAKIDLAKRKLYNGEFYLSRYKYNDLLDDINVDYHVLVDMLVGEVYVFRATDYDVVVEGRGDVVVSDSSKGYSHYILKDGKLSWGDIEYFCNHTRSSTRADFKGYPALRFPDKKINKYRHSLRIHWIIATMAWGIDAVQHCIGTQRTLEIDHINPIGQGGSNSINNLRVLSIKKHEHRHKGYKSTSLDGREYLEAPKTIKKEEKPVPVDPLKELVAYHTRSISPDELLRMVSGR